MLAIFEIGREALPSFKEATRKGRAIRITVRMETQPKQPRRSVRTPKRKGSAFDYEERPVKRSHRPCEKVGCPCERPSCFAMSTTGYGVGFISIKFPFAYYPCNLWILLQSLGLCKILNIYKYFVFNYLNTVAPLINEGTY